MKIVDRTNAVEKLKKLVFTSKDDVQQFRNELENEFKVAYLPSNVELDSILVSDIKTDYLIPEVFAKDRVILYVHGGSFVGGSLKAYRSFCCSITNASTTKMYVPEFRLPPEYPYPAAIEDVSAVLDSLMNQEIILMADGSGASIALAAVFNMNKFLRKNIREIVLFSPWLDFSIDSILYTQHHNYDEILSADALRRSVDNYTYRSNQKNPLVSPFYANSKELENFPSVYIQCGEKEFLLDNYRSFAHLLYKNDIKCTIDSEPKMMFMFQMADEYVPQAHLAVERLGMHIQERDF